MEDILMVPDTILLKIGAAEMFCRCPRGDRSIDACRRFCTPSRTPVCTVSALNCDVTAELVASNGRQTHCRSVLWASVFPALQFPIAFGVRGRPSLVFSGLLQTSLTRWPRRSIRGTVCRGGNCIRCVGTSGPLIRHPVRELRYVIAC
jgi:hypothetical protein